MSIMKGGRAEAMMAMTIERLRCSNNRRNVQGKIQDEADKAIAT